MMFRNLGFTELLIIALFIILFFGAKRIPGIAKSIGEAIREFRKSSHDDEGQGSQNSGHNSR